MKTKKNMRIRNIIVLILGLTIICGLSTGAVLDVAAKEITVTEINSFTGKQESQTIKTYKEESVSDFLTEHGYEITIHDTLSAEPDSLLEDQDSLTIIRGVPVGIEFNGTLSILSVTKPTVGDALAEAGYSVADNFLVSPGVDEPVSSGMHIQIIQMEEKQETISETVPREVEYVNDSTLLAGKTKVVSQGKDGVIEIVQRVTYHNGKEISREEISRTETPAEKKVIAKGTATQKTKATTAKKTTAKTAAKNTTAVKSGAGTIAGYSYSKALTMNSTAYSAFKKNGEYGITASGRKAGHGIVAVDPSVIPLGTKVYIEGYGVAIAADTGGAIKGNKIDLCFEASNASLRQYGRRNIVVYILN